MSDRIAYCLLGLGAGIFIGNQANKLINKKKEDVLDFKKLKQEKKQLKLEKAQGNKNYSSEEYKKMIKEQLVRNI